MGMMMNQKQPKLPYDRAYKLGETWRAVREWRQPDTVPYMKRRALEYLAPRLALWISVLSLALHSYWAAVSKCGVNFQRGGAIIVLSAASLYAVLE